MSRGILFDFDDTLVETTLHFDKAKGIFTEMMKELGFPAGEALEVLDQNDIKNVRLCGGFLNLNPVSNSSFFFRSLGGYQK